MTILSKYLACMVLVFAGSLSVGSVGSAQTKGGDAIVALYANTSSIDPNFSASHISGSILFGVYEGLVTVDDNTNVIPMIARSWTLSDDGLIYTFKLRRGVKFHNGKELTSEDVKASLERYAKISPERITMDLVDRIEIVDPYEIKIVLKHPSPTFLSRLSSPANPSSIIPAEEAMKGLNKTANIGTGPFKVVEWIPDSHVKLERFDGYVANGDFKRATGFGGKKTAYLDSVTFRIVTEASARVAALEAGEIHLAEDIPVPSATRLERNPKVRIHRLNNFNMPVLFLNHSAAPTNNLKFRQAIQAALDLDQVMAGGTDGLYQLDHSWLWPGNSFYSEAGKELYDINNAKRAKVLLQASGYKHEPVHFVISNVSFHIKFGTIIVEQLRAIGLNIKPVMVDLATLVAVTQSDRGWHLAINGFRSAPFLGAYAYEPILSGPSNWARIKHDPAMQNAWNIFNTSMDENIRKESWSEIQMLTYANVQTVKLGNQGFLIGASTSLKGYRPYVGGERMWDVWLE